MADPSGCWWLKRPLYTTGGMIITMVSIPPGV